MANTRGVQSHTKYNIQGKAPAAAEIPGGKSHMLIQSDFHIHSRNSFDTDDSSIADIASHAAEHGVREFGISDHLFSPYNLPDIRASSAEYNACGPIEGFHFGVEASSVSQWEINEIATGKVEAPITGLRSGGPPGGPLAIGITAEDIDALQIEVVVGGVHWPMYVPLERKAVIHDYHRQNMFLACHPLVDIIAHPWWWHEHWADEDGCFRSEPWFDDFSHIPQSMHDEFAAAVVQHQKTVEINLYAMLLAPVFEEHFSAQYLDYLASLKEAGVQLCIGSDFHGAEYGEGFPRASTMLASVGSTHCDCPLSFLKG